MSRCAVFSRRGRSITRRPACQRPLARLHSYLSSRGAERLLGAGVAVEDLEHRPPDRRLPARVGDLCAGEVGDVEDIDRLLAEGRDMGRGDVEVELPDDGREVIEQPWPV